MDARSRGRGGTLLSLAACFQYYNTDQITMKDSNVIRDLAVELFGIKTSWNNDPPIPSDNGVSFSKLVEVLRPSSVLTPSSNKGKTIAYDSSGPTPPIIRSGSPPLIIWSFVLSSFNLGSTLPENSHSMVVDRVLFSWMAITRWVAIQKMKTWKIRMMPC